MNKLFSILVLGVLAGVALMGCSGGTETTENKPAEPAATGESDNKAGGAVQDRTQATGDFK